MSFKANGKTVRCLNYVPNSLHDEHVTIERTGQLDSNKNELYTEIDRHLNLYSKIKWGAKIMFNKKEEFDLFFELLDKYKVERNKEFKRTHNMLLYIYSIPVTHFITKYTNDKEVTQNTNCEFYIKFCVTFFNDKFTHDDAYHKYSPEWYYGKDTRPKNSPKSVMNIYLKQQIEEYYEDYYSDMDLESIEDN